MDVIITVHTLNLFLVQLYAYFSTVNPSISLSFAFLYSDDIVVPTVEIKRATHVNH